MIHFKRHDCYDSSGPAVFEFCRKTRYVPGVSVGHEPYFLRRVGDDVCYALDGTVLPDALAQG